MRKTWFIALTTLLTLSLAPGRAAAQVPHTDAGFALQAAAAGKKEVDSATLAAREASNSEVKALAQRLVKDHTVSNHELESMMRDRKGTPTQPAPAPKADKWRTETGVAFDRAYVRHVIEEHEDAIELFEAQSVKGTDPELREWAKAKLPTLRDHLKMARDLRATLGS